MKVKNVMIRNVVTATPETSYEEAALLMHQHNITGLPVVDEKGILIGVVTDKDLFRALYPLYEDYAKDPDSYRDPDKQEDEIEAIRKFPIKRFMSRDVLTIEPDEPIMRAGGIMLAYKIHRLPVVENGKLVGIITRKDIYGPILQNHLNFK